MWNYIGLLVAVAVGMAVLRDWQSARRYHGQDRRSRSDGGDVGWGADSSDGSSDSGGDGGGD